MLDFIFYINLWLLFSILIISFLFANFICFKLGQMQRVNTSNDAKTEVTGIQVAFFGLLALLLAFSFTMSATRFETRKQLILQESNAIGTSYLRTELLAQPQQLALQNTFRTYVATLLEFYNAAKNSNDIMALNQQILNIQNQLWSLGVAAAAKDPRPFYSIFFLTSLNSVIDDYNSLITSARNHVPDLAIWLLFFVAIFTMGLTGYRNGLDDKPNNMSMILCSIVIATVIFVILDLDRPVAGLIQVSEKNFIDLQNSIKATAK